MASSNVRAAYRRLRSLGLTPAQAAGAVGGLTGESGPNLDPSARNPSSGAIGIGQWLGGRAKGVKPGDLEGQLNHLVGELKGSERGALAALKGAKGPREAAEIWTRTFERPSAGEIAASLPARQKAAQRILAELHGEAPDSGGGTTKAGAIKSTGDVTPATEQASREAAVMQVLGEHHKVKGALKRSALKRADYLYKTGQATERVGPKETLQTTATNATRQGATPGAGGATPGGSFKVTGADPGRLKPELVSFARKVAGVYGHTLTGDSGAGHSRLTTSGNVSEHTTGNATDIPATGAKLKAMGQAALIAAGMPEAEARKAQGGLYNVGNHQIIFLTNIGGNHFNHLHISTHAKRR